MGIAGLPEDFYVGSVRLGSEEKAHRIIDLGPDTSSASLEITVFPSGERVEGIVKDDGDKPASGVLVTMVPEIRNRFEQSLFKNTTTDQNGIFAIRGITPGSTNYSRGTMSSQVQSRTLSS